MEHFCLCAAHDAKIVHFLRNEIEMRSVHITPTDDDRVFAEEIVFLYVGYEIPA